MSGAKIEKVGQLDSWTVGQYYIELKMKKAISQLTTIVTVGHIEKHIDPI
jgi:hypothetical protein